MGNVGWVSERKENLLSSTSIYCIISIYLAEADQSSTEERSIEIRRLKNVLLYFMDWNLSWLTAAWWGNNLLIRIRPGYGSDVESIPPVTDSPSPPNPFTISTLNVQSENYEMDTIGLVKEATMDH